jgi:methionine aminopeptidase
MENIKNVRSSIARDVLNFIIKNYSELPFCSRWIVKKFGTRALFGLKQLEDNRNIHQFPQLVETGKVSQAEHTILVDKSGIVITTD